MMERYSEYKDSGVKWLGEIPSHWEVVPLRKYLKINTRRNMPEAQLLSVTREEGVIVRNVESKEENHNYIPDDLSNYKYVQRGQFVINKMKSWQGSYGVSNYDGIVSPAYFVYDLNYPNKDYFNIAIRSRMFSPFFSKYSKGIRVDQWDLTPEALKIIPFLEPPKAEQDAIVRYLDTATSEIDKAIAMQQKMIDLLNERKQIIIQNAVTKGLDENVEMKESGVEFVNEIPHNWSTRRLKFSAWIRARLGWKGLKASEYVENGYPFLSAFNIENDHMKWNNLNFINKYRYDESPEIKLKVGDLLLVKDGAGIGKCARIDELPYGESTANGSLAVITSYDMLDYRYLYYFMVSKSFKDHTELLINGMGVPHFTQGEMKKIVMPVPPQAEQQQIVTYLDSEMQRFDSAITNCQRQITLLQERKQIIINEVVTGKVRVS
nr:restriction endonuclease subunit S [uncultured Prevotella sp.]